VRLRLLAAQHAEGIAAQIARGSASSLVRACQSTACVPARLVRVLELYIQPALTPSGPALAWSFLISRHPRPRSAAAAPLSAVAAVGARGTLSHPPMLTGLVWLQNKRSAERRLITACGFPFSRARTRAPASVRARCPGGHRNSRCMDWCVPVTRCSPQAVQAEFCPYLDRSGVISVLLA